MSRRGQVWQEGRAKGAPALRGAPWYFVADIAPPGAPRRQVKRRGFATQATAQAALDELLGTVRDGSRVEPSRDSFGAYLNAWIKALPTTGRRPSTIASYANTLDAHVLRRDVAQVPLQSLTAVDLDGLYADLLAGGGRSAKGLSMRTVRYVHTIVSKALKDARRKGLVRSNVAEDATPPAATAARAPEFTAWTPDELRRFLGAVAGHHHGALFRLAAMTGMRRGELVGLRWDDVDLEGGRLVVRHAITFAGGQLVEGGPKTARGRRSIDLDPVTVATLRSHRTRQLEERLLVGAGYDDRGLVFAGPDGRPWQPDSITGAFDRLVAKHELRRIRLHDLRHTHASHLLAAGVNAKVVSERLGHSSVSFTLDVYGHVMPGQQADAAAAVARLVEG